MTSTAVPRFPLYIPSKSRAGITETPGNLDRMGVDYLLVVEESQRDAYAAHHDPARLLTLDPAFQRDYETLDDEPDDKPKGPGPARNFIWQHAIEHGYSHHWVMDDNIRWFIRLHRNQRLVMLDGTGFHAMETFVLRYVNVAMAGPQYVMFAPSRSKFPPFVTGTRIYSCNLIRNDVPFRWRGRYNEDTILSLDVMKAGWNTVQFNAFLQRKAMTQTIGGGNTEEFYKSEGTAPKTAMLARVHPDVTSVVWKYGRPHHYVDYSSFKGMPLVRRPGSDQEPAPEYHLQWSDESVRVHGQRRFLLPH